MEQDKHEQFGDEGKKHKRLMKLADDLCKESKERVARQQLFGNVGIYLEIERNCPRVLMYNLLLLRKTRTPLHLKHDL